MEKTYKRVPFDIELAKKIVSGEVIGRLTCDSIGNAIIGIIELPEETPKQEFKPFDKVVVRSNLNGIWEPRLYSRRCTDGSYAHYCQDGRSYGEILPYEGNEHLVGTTDNPKELC